MFRIQEKTSTRCEVWKLSSLEIFWFICSISLFKTHKLLL